METEITRIFLYICTRKPSINCNMFRLEATWMWQYGHDTIPDWDGKLLIVDTDSHNSLVETNALPGTIAAYGSPSCCMGG